MYKVLIVDDEPIVGVTIKSLVDWEAHNISMAFEAFNGKQALKLLEENEDIDVVITDISMPVMDGLDLIQAMKERGMTAEILVLSAYEDYSLVRNAFKLGARDYILKTQMDGERLLALLKSILEKLPEDRPVIRRGNHTDPVPYPQREKALKEILSGEGTPKGNVGLNLSPSHLIAAVVRVDDIRAVEKRYAGTIPESFANGVLNTVRQVLSQLPFGESTSFALDTYGLVLSLPAKEEQEALAATKQIMYEIKTNLANFMNIHVSIGVSDAGDGWENLPWLYTQAERNAAFRCLLGQKQILFPEDTVPISGNGTAALPRWEQYLEALAGSDEKKTLSELEQKQQYINGLPGALSEKYPYYAALLQALVQSVLDSGEEITTIAADESLCQRLLSFKTEREINRWIRRLVEKWISFQKRKTDTSPSLVISKAIHFTKENFRDVNISVGMVSGFLGLSENHFSMLFKKEVGDTFTGYLTNLRIEEAKRLMRTTNLKVYEICENVGYSNVEHFSRSFKKVTGHSPNQYKKHYSME